MTIRILYFARTRELAGASEEDMELPGDGLPLRDVLARIAARHPALAPVLRQIRVARNEAFAELDERTEHGDVIALIPPVAGG